MHFYGDKHSNFNIFLGLYKHPKLMKNSFKKMSFPFSIAFFVFVAFVAQKALATCPYGGDVNVSPSGQQGCVLINGLCNLFPETIISGGAQFCSTSAVSVSTGGCINLGVSGAPNCQICGMTTIRVDTSSSLQICVTASGSISCLNGGDSICIPVV